ncbi:response regulator [Roseibacterium sp. SDUM158017]|uniref:response regulator n=1 Tax=Roseicyclus salinarum TaxID=3036773 RepID=UPI00241520F0|nr:response regulator [Roseibacterium sp. SDUM158017]MDG4650645.1 response regulator [Roseibacterium sp. SDUM158017]
MSELVPIPQPELEPVTTVLVVEDEVLIRLDVAEEIRLAGLDVLEASSAEEALDLLAAGSRVDVVFSDYQLSGTLDGWKLRSILKERHPHLHFILTSAQRPPGDVKDAQVRFFPKPYHAPSVVDAISKVTEETDSDGST